MCGCRVERREGREDQRRYRQTAGNAKLGGGLNWQTAGNCACVLVGWPEPSSRGSKTCLETLSVGVELMPLVTDPVKCHIHSNTYPSPALPVSGWALCIPWHVGIFVVLTPLLPSCEASNCLQGPWVNRAPFLSLYH